MGVERSCSIVPCSHSLETVSEVRRALITPIMIAIRPGMMNQRLFSSGLYHTRNLRSIWPESPFTPFESEYREAIASV